MDFPKYPHIDPLYKLQQQILACEEVVCTEKIHGANFRVMSPSTARTRGDIVFGSRNNVVTADSGFYANKPVMWFLNRPEILDWMVGRFFGRDVVLFGEVYGSGIQRGVKYFNIDAMEFRAFDLMVDGRMLDYGEFADLTDEIDIRGAPLLYLGPPLLSKLNSLLECDSTVGKRNGVDTEGKPNIAEGYVVRPTKMTKDHHGQWLIAKHKSEGFAEEQKGRKGPISPRIPSDAQLLAERYVTRGRVLNAREKWMSSGGVVHDHMKDMQWLPEVVIADVKDDLMWLDVDESEALDAAYEQKAFNSAITKQTAVVYSGILKEQLKEAAE